ncbi:hypothetical protein CPB83DRAFT_893497 [Crepidotus variabilis]|uniref:Mitochondrial intermembrane space import and assembly protein 40 n=1 Tax=Crepidotus variabilis TaxID=179855 RepID=A0A9P6JR04_9AGAR|nr:hypothetical protein CPB83DRAFT_893497 [Crepidotus variabilis]
MFAGFTRLPLRRCIHTASSTGKASSSFGRTAKVVLGASAVTATYMTWRLTQEGNRLALDSPAPSTTSKLGQSSPKLSRTPPAPSEPPKASESTAFQPDAPSSSPADGGFMPDSKELDITQPEKPSAKGEDSEGGESSGSGKPASSGAFNPETGEINWDCPCLGGMADGPCGPQFKEAFSCFVFSEEEPKGINCVEKFQAMQTCFKAHPEVYADQLMDDDDDEEPANAEKSEGLPPVEEPKDVLAPEATLEEKAEKKPPLQKPQPVKGA